MLGGKKYLHITCVKCKICIRITCCMFIFFPCILLCERNFLYNETLFSTLFGAHSHTHTYLNTYTHTYIASFEFIICLMFMLLNIMPTPLACMRSSTKEVNVHDDDVIGGLKYILYNSTFTCEHIKPPTHQPTPSLTYIENELMFSCA